MNRKLLNYETLRAKELIIREKKILSPFQTRRAERRADFEDLVIVFYWIHGRETEEADKRNTIAYDYDGNELWRAEPFAPEVSNIQSSLYLTLMQDPENGDWYLQTLYGDCGKLNFATGQVERNQKFVYR